MESLSALPHAAVVGIGATAVMDLWLLALKRIGVPTMDFALLGRWVGHVLRGQVAHEAIRRARPIAGELGFGWLTHYAVGIVFAGLLVALQGVSWLDDPTLLPALAWGLAPVRVAAGDGCGHRLVAHPGAAEEQRAQPGEPRRVRPGPLLQCGRLVAVGRLTRRRADARRTLLATNAKEPMMLPKKLAPTLFGLLLSGMMSLLVSGLATWRATGLAPGFVVSWAGAWLLAWPIAFPAVLLAAPLARRAVNRLVADA
jgi:hypothetical protein